MAAPRLEGFEASGLTCVGAGVGGRGVSFAFVGRTGGVSRGPFASLNVGGHCGDDPQAVEENRRRCLAAVGASHERVELLVPRQVHGVRVVSVTDGEAMDSVRQVARSGADAVVCTVPGVVALLVFADCVPIMLVSSGAFAVVHAGWRGALAGIPAIAARELAGRSGCSTRDLWAYVGPYIGPASYEVSEELLGRFVDRFGSDVAARRSRRLDLGAAVLHSLREAGLEDEGVASCGIDTASQTREWFSYRVSGGICGRHGTLAWIAGSPGETEGGETGGRR